MITKHPQKNQIVKVWCYWVVVKHVRENNIIGIVDSIDYEYLNNIDFSKIDYYKIIGNKGEGEREGIKKMGDKIYFNKNDIIERFDNVFIL